MDKKEITYILELNDDVIENHTLIKQTTLTDVFIGKLINTTCSNFYFEDNKNSDTMIIIPHNWIKWMAPLNESTTR